MKLHHQDTPVYGSGNIEMKSFSIATSAKAFRILSSNLYKYKIRAIIRELSCNAVDGHIALKNTGVEPRATFDVQLPTMLDSQFRVRDYGIGLSHEDVMNLYTTYFASTKSNSNDFVGALGLGSKSPFAYTDTFTVTSWFNGTKTVYSAFIKDGEPNIAPVHSEESNEPSGVEIVVPCGNDLDQWTQEAHRVYSSFSMYRPNFVGKKLDIQYLKSATEARTFVVERQTPHGNGVHAIMGGVVYPIPNEFWEQKFISIWAGTKAYYVHFELGELDITPSREELSLDDATIANIKLRMDGLDADYEKELNSIFASSPSVRALHKTINAKYPAAVWERICDKRDYKGKTIKEWKNEFSVYSVHSMRNLWVVSYTSDMIRRKEVKKTRWYYNIFDPSECIKFGQKPRTCIINDLDTKNHNMVLRGLHELKTINLHESALMFNVNDPVNGAFEQINADNYIKCWDQQHDGLIVVRLSEHKEVALKKLKDMNYVDPAKPKAKRTGPSHNVVVVSYENGKMSTEEVKMFAQDIDELEDVLWCGTFYDDIVEVEWNSGKTDTDNSFLASLQRVKEWVEFRKKDCKVYVFRKPQWRRALNNDSITQIKDLVKATFVDAFNTFSPTDVPISANQIPRWVERMNHPVTRDLYNSMVNINIGSDRYFFLTNLNSWSVAKELAAEKLDFEKKVNATKVQSNSVWDKFKKDNPLLYKLLNNIYSLEDDVAKDLLLLARV